ncbi:hypothetical protein KFL_008170040 [Klebsormidium nitens]|uniref:NAC domain-containing protein n=1 Tax=Klebsormidium nitens TaxID=105231 RepID=A0A1Y1ITT6_KLENI|nr:hypothetical protein KFL_008170040 [Klebsormidium nitens]|eukprot:GAQ91608.1 hypothetical protein KFL_008170040 [Klebsormidium nitens]
MATLIRFKIQLTLESSHGNKAPENGSGDLVLKGKVTEGRGALEFRMGSTSKDWLVSQLEHSVVEKMCQVARQGIDTFLAGGSKGCSGLGQAPSQTQDTFGLEGKDLVYPMSLPFKSNPGTPNCAVSGQDEPLTSAFGDSFAEVSNELVDESEQTPSMTRQASVGVAFRPTDQELLSLLRDRVENGTGHDNVEELPQSTNIDPQYLLSSSGSRASADPPTPSSARFFFCTRTRAKNGAWSRKTRSGWWDQERNPNSFSPGDDDAQKVIFNHKSKGRAWTGLKWQMHEYQISKNEPLVLCKVMQVADRPRRKGITGVKREPVTATTPPPEKVRKLHYKRPRVPLQLPTSHSSTLNPGGIPQFEGFRPKEETAAFDDEPSFAADLFSLLSPSPRFGKLLALPSPRADSWIYHVLSQALPEPGKGAPENEGEGESAQQSSPGDSSEGSGQSDAYVGACLGCGKTGELRQESNFCQEGACIICGRTDESYDANTHLCARCDQNVRNWNRQAGN